MTHNYFPKRTSGVERDISSLSSRLEQVSAAAGRDAQGPNSNPAANNGQFNKRNEDVNVQVQPQRWVQQ